MFKKVISCSAILAVSVLYFYAQEDKESQLPAWFKDNVSDNEVREALRRYPQLVNVYNTSGYTGLHRAVIKNDLLQVKFFVEAGADINLPVKNKSIQNGDTALNLAIFGVNTRNDTEIPTYLINKEADVNKANAEGVAPIHQLLWVTDHNLRMDVAKKLIAKDVEVNAQTKAGNTMLHLSADKYDKKWIDMAKESFGSLLDFYIKNNDGLTPLGLSKKLQQLGDDSVVSSLLSDYEVLGEGWGGQEKSNKLGQTGLMLAIYRNDSSFAEKMIKKGANVNAEDDNGLTPLFYAVESERPVYYIKELIAKGADVKLRDKKGQTPLMLVPKIKEPKKRVEAARLLIDAGIDVNAKDKQGNSFWHYVAQIADHELIADISQRMITAQKNKEGKTAADIAREQLSNGTLPKEEKERLEKTIKALGAA